jgi:predicted cupin superfamily sugar epimerase
MTAAEIIHLLDLTPHPEGGYYRETFRDTVTIDGRAASTCIYFLLPHGVTSRWHRVDAVETWHWYAGSPLDLSIAASDQVSATQTLGPALDRGERPQAVVPMNYWQQARSRGAWTLVGCTVAPGFTFAGFEIAGVEFSPKPESP